MNEIVKIHVWKSSGFVENLGYEVGYVSWSPSHKDTSFPISFSTKNSLFCFSEFSKKFIEFFRFFWIFSCIKKTKNKESKQKLIKVVWSHGGDWSQQTTRHRMGQPINGLIGLRISSRIRVDAQTLRGKCTVLMHIKNYFFNFFNFFSLFSVFFFYFLEREALASL